MGSLHYYYISIFMKIKAFCMKYDRFYLVDMGKVTL